MRRLVPILAVLTLLGLGFSAPGATASSDTEAAALKRCPTPRSFTVGPFFADQLRARGVGCRKARTVAKRWGNCRFSGPNDRICRVRGGYVCRYREIPGFEGGRTTCKRGRSRAVGFRWGS